MKLDNSSEQSLYILSISMRNLTTHGVGKHLTSTSSGIGVG